MKLKSIWLGGLLVLVAFLFAVPTAFADNTTGNCSTGSNGGSGSASGGSGSGSSTGGDGTGILGQGTGGGSGSSGTGGGAGSSGAAGAAGCQTNQTQNIATTVQAQINAQRAAQRGRLDQSGSATSGPAVSTGGTATGGDGWLHRCCRRQLVELLDRLG